MNYRDILGSTRKRLEAAGIPDASFEARQLVCAAAALTPEKLALSYAEEFFSGERLDAMLSRRLRLEPLQYIIGKWEFFGMDFFVGSGVLVPRQDTELIVELALEFAGKMTAPAVFADLCSGSGCIAAAFEKNSGSVKSLYAIEKSPEAFEYLKKNIALHSSRITPVLADVTLAETAAALPLCDIITCNPPYLTSENMEKLQSEVRYEPKTALYGGNGGLELYKSISAVWHDRLADNGVIIFEYGIGQETAVSEILAENGYADIRLHRDLTGRNRAVSASPI